LSKDVLQRLLECETEAEVQAVIESEPFLADPKNWRPLDARETNFNVTSNQASDGGKALTELMTNMVDAILMKAARQKGVPLTGKGAPPTMYAAVDKLIKNLRGGKLVNLEPRDPWLRDFAQKNLVLGITGAKNKDEGLPCFTFIDNGEGQAPEDFPDTFLSLSAGTKKSIPFVQGKYNMGSSGVLRYCGRRWFKLVVSRRFDKSSPWGWTLMRRRPGSAEDMPIAEYCVLPDGSIPSFDAPDLYPLRNLEGKRYDGVHIETGTVVKLYDYQVGRRFMSFRGSREALNENLVETILPFRLLDLRQKPDKKRGGDRALGVDARPFYGMEYLLLNSHREEGLEDEEDAAGLNKIDVGSFTDPELGEVSIGAIVLRRDLPGWLKPQSSNNRVFHAVNGQVHHKRTRGYLTTCGFPALKDRIVIVVDASKLHFGAHNEVWKGDREHLSQTLLGEKYEDEVNSTIKGSGTLKDLQNKIAQQELETASKTERNELFQKLVDYDPALAALLSDRDPSINVPGQGGGGKGDVGKGEFPEAKHSPSFVRLDERFTASPFEVPLNRARKILAHTDAEDGFFHRSDNRGSLIFADDDSVREKFVVRQYLARGHLALFLQPVSDKVKLGDTLSFRIGLLDPSMPEPVYSDQMTVVVAKEDEQEPRKRRKPKPPGSSARGLPPFKLLTKDGREINGQDTEAWPEDFSAVDGGLVRDLGEGKFIYLINYDNVYHLKYRMRERGDIARDVVTEKYILGMRIVMLALEHALRNAHKPQPDAEGATLDDVLDEVRQVLSRAAASTVLALAENLPKIIDASAVRPDDVE